MTRWFIFLVWVGLVWSGVAFGWELRPEFATISATEVGDERVDILLEESPVFAWRELVKEEELAVVNGEAFSGQALYYFGGVFTTVLFEEGRRVVDRSEQVQRRLRAQMFDENRDHGVCRVEFRAYLADLERPLGHDDFIAFTRTDFGEDADIPRLIRELCKMRDREDGMMTCTKVHCVDALKKLTGADAGYTGERWLRWYVARTGILEGVR